ncbi:MAG: urease accessory protein UreE [Cyanobacteria bacterium]|jgi:urease accessory protein|nr:urease accessory protein UreE [Cyanobacteriota bacterium]
MEEVLLLTRRQATRPLQLAQHWRLALRADERTQLRGRRHCQDGQAVLLQLPRQAPLQPGEWLLPAVAATPGAADRGAPHPGVAVEVLAAAEALLQVRSSHPLALLQAAYHLGNRHVAMELHPDRLLLLHDSVLADLLRQRGLQVECLEAPFLPEPGAYAGTGHGHHH